MIADVPLLRKLRDKLEEFVEGNQFVWQELAEEPGDLLRRALRQAVEEAGRSDSVPLLDECWGWLTDKRALAQVKAYCVARHRDAPVDAERLHRNACALVATAQAAVAAKQAKSHGDDAVGRLLRWGQETARLLDDAAVQGEQKLPLQWTDADFADPARLIDRAYETLSG